MDRPTAPLYDRAFHDDLHKDALPAARVIVPLVLDLLGPVRSVVDVGCSLGAWLSEFRRAGVARCVGLDGDYVERDRLMIPPADFYPVDLARPVRSPERFDLAMSLEVAEHLPRERSIGFVVDLVALAPVVLFSAAVPGQTGAGHINEAWQDSWVTRFRSRGYEVIDAIRPAVWTDRRVAWWYRQNMLLFASRDALAARPALAEAAARTDRRRLSLVHPEVFLSRMTSLQNALTRLVDAEQRLAARTKADPG
ncbi:MAG: class I SAM-dependent methyltransferase [Alphaproteobacteria bacterium]|nr:class I SAM-dependent methyltransferase [Alphaproteobacteria bacterium]